MTAVKSYDEEKKASPVIISGDSVSILSGKDTRISASQIIASHDVTAAAGGNIYISSAPEYESHDYEKQVKKNQEQDISTLNRNTESSLNKPKEIFDKSKVEEKQELIQMK
ncbi:hemagglutinin repeat-containing protein [uncultured Dialister sp.]|uniref:hemagglutinin repeat-containing protein n=1 Tax=uncultured Dialister sp. TaxID=278064 RepID=UPI00338E1E9C